MGIFPFLDINGWLQATCFLKFAGIVGDNGRRKATRKIDNTLVEKSRKDSNKVLTKVATTDTQYLVLMKRKYGA